MFSKFKLLLSGLTMLSLLYVSPALAAGANDQIFGACNNDTSGSSVCQTDKNPSTNPVADTINKAADIIAVLTGVAAVVMIIISGFSFVTSGGNSEQVTNARRRLIYSIVGLVVVALAWSITRFVVDRVIQ